MTNIGMYKVTAPDQATLAPGWWLGFSCRSCRRQFGVFADAFNGAKREMKGGGTIYCLCPHCDAPGYFAPSDMTSFKVS